ncbi:MAG: hypothetical protein K8I65_09165 [Thermoanaerobaculia bacterium]|nr:hypothetical protein [Thermoanaerobaculia bacterium]
MRPKVAGTVALAGAAMAFACAPPARGPDSARREVTIATTVDLAGVNELVSGGVRFTTEVLDLLQLHLLDEQPDWAAHPPTLAPRLAESWQLSPDQRSLTFRLRADARWSDGTPVTAEDVRFTFAAQTAETVAWSYAGSKAGIAGVDVLDPRTVRFRLRSSSPAPLVDVNDGRILPAHAWRPLPLAQWRTGESFFRRRAVASGPFRLAGWRSGLGFTLERNPRYFDPDPRGPERVRFRVVPDPASLLERLLAGEFDFFDGLSPRDAARVERSPRLRVVATAARQFDYIGWNGRRAPFDDAQVRRALTLAIDREELVRALWHGRARVGAGPIPAGAWARDPELAPWPYDPDGARQLLARRGFADGDGDGVLERDGVPLRFVLLTNSGNRLRADAAALICDQLRRVGVAATARAVEMQLLTELNLSGDYDATLAGWSIDTTFDLRPWFHSAEIADGWNFVAYANPQLDRLLAGARATAELPQARQLLIEAQRILHAEQPYTFLWEPQRLSAVAADLEGVEITPLAALGSLHHWRRR